jgi:hypothetical protein
MPASGPFREARAAPGAISGMGPCVAGSSGRSLARVGFTPRIGLRNLTTPDKSRVLTPMSVRPILASHVDLNQSSDASLDGLRVAITGAARDTGRLLAETCA